MQQATIDTARRLSNGSPDDFETLLASVATGRRTTQHDALDIDDVDYIVGQAVGAPEPNSDIAWLARGLVPGLLMNFFDVAPRDGRISAGEWRDGLGRWPGGAGVRLRPER